MLWCPNCKTEYREGYKTCSDCGADLVEKPQQPPETGDPQYDREAFLVSVSNQIEADMLEALLKANEIPVLMKYREADDYLKIYMGGTNFGVDLYVPSHMLSNAQSVIEASRGANADDFTTEGQEAEPDAGQAGIHEPEEEGEYSGTGEEGEGSEGAEGRGESPEDTGKSPEDTGKNSVGEDRPEAVPGMHDSVSEDAETAKSEEEAFNRKRRFRTWVIILIFSSALIIAVFMWILDLCGRLIGRW